MCIHRNFFFYIIQCMYLKWHKGKKLTTIAHQRSYWNDLSVCLSDNLSYHRRNPFQRDTQSMSWILNREIQCTESLSIPNGSSSAMKRKRGENMCKWKLKDKQKKNEFLVLSIIAAKITLIYSLKRIHKKWIQPHQKRLTRNSAWLIRLS